MRKPTGSWLNTLRSLGLKSTSGRRAASRNTRLTGEQLEARALLATVELYGATSVAEYSTANYYVTISESQSFNTVINYKTTAGTADGNDFTMATSAVTIYAGDYAASFSVGTSSDYLDEDDETFSVSIDSIENGSTLSISAGVSAEVVTTIYDDDDAPTLSISDDSVSEGSTAHVTLNLSTASGRAISVGYSTSGGSASGGDYTNSPGAVTFSPGQTQKVIDIATTSDSIDEADETFSVYISADSSIVSVPDSSADVTIGDDDTATLGIGGGGSVNEGGTATFTISLSTEADHTISTERQTPVPCPEITPAWRAAERTFLPARRRRS